ncbi:hypothetical protein AB0K09_04180 [Streptomyces sp. NPDC049577]|uniref:hypothetical protein n=1 Tax=Streptomyces sp. NPDC049577 TaxID=3155153 RepID=UPI0034455320
MSAMSQRRPGDSACGSGRIVPLRDWERVLGQVERGEVRAGPDAARAIAARHQAAYGSAVWPSQADVAWADAVAALKEEAA